MSDPSISDDDIRQQIQLLLLSQKLRRSSSTVRNRLKCDAARRRNRHNRAIQELAAARPTSESDPAVVAERCDLVRWILARAEGCPHHREIVRGFMQGKSYARMADERRISKTRVAQITERLRRSLQGN